MADPFGFLKYERVDNPYREINERIKDFNYLEEPLKWCSLLSYWCVVRR